jgi:hypothetical protein
MLDCRLKTLAAGPRCARPVWYRAPIDHPTSRRGARQLSYLANCTSTGLGARSGDYLAPQWCRSRVGAWVGCLSSPDRRSATARLLTGAVAMTLIIFSVHWAHCRAPVPAKYCNEAAVTRDDGSVTWEEMLLGPEGDIPRDASDRASSCALGTFAGPKFDYIIGDVDITVEEFAIYKEALDRLLRLEYRPTFRMVERNFRQLTNLHRYYEKLFAQVKEKGRIDTEDAGFSLVGETMNWLTAVRLFLDQETEYKRRHGRQSSQVERFESARRAAYDNSLGYRFTYKLRNYAQHCGLPLSSVQLRLPKHGESGVQRIEFHLKRDDLLRDYDEWGPVKKDLKAMAPAFTLLPLVADAMEALRTLAQEVLRIDIEYALEGVPTIRDALNRLEGRPGRRALMVFTPNRDGTVRFNFAYLPDEESFARIEALVGSSDDLLKIINPAKVGPPLPPRSSDQQHRDKRGIAVMSAWLQEGGGTPKFFEIVNDLLREDGDIEPVLSGLVNLSGVALAMAAAAVGSTPAMILGSMASSAMDTRAHI